MRRPIVNPLKDVPDHVVAAVGADAAVVLVDGRRVADSEFEAVALLLRKLVAPRVESAVGAAGGFLPLPARRQSLACPRRVSVGFVSAHARHGVVGLGGCRLSEVKVAGALLRDEGGLLHETPEVLVRHRVLVDVKIIVDDLNATLDAEEERTGGTSTMTRPTLSVSSFFINFTTALLGCKGCR